MSENDVVKTCGLTKIFGRKGKGITAVDNLNLEIYDGEVFGFLGPNGSGKTTTIGILLGLINPSWGSIELFGQEMAGNSAPLLRRVGVVMDRPAFFPYLSGKNNLKYFAMSIGDLDNKRIDDLMEMVELKNRANDKVREYSMGMKQRLAVALALLNDPELIILDEPTNGLDPSGIIEFRELIRTMNRQGKTIFLSSHLLHEVEQVCTHVALIDKGRILASGSVKELLGNRKSIRLMVSDVEKAVVILQNNDWVKSVKKEGDSIIVEAPENKTAAINELLTGNGIHVFEMQKCENSLEDFFLKTIGEKEIANNMEEEDV
jgi:ABC-2 type transport system ATP-binding protein